MSRLLKALISRRGFLGLTLAALSGVKVDALSASTIPTLKVISATSSRIVIAVSSSTHIQGYVEYGTSPNALSKQSKKITASKSAQITLQDLTSNTTYYFRLKYTLATSKVYKTTKVLSAITSASVSSSVFAVQADPHMDENSDEKVYLGTLSQIKKSAPAFLMDLGDIFMVDKLADKSEANIRARFELMKNYYKTLGDVPLKICLGNHDGELGYSKFNTKSYRQEYFPEQTGDLAYFSFTGPDQLHVVLDPFTYTTQNPKADGWQWTLGRTQYDWMVKTLSQSTALHKFVYIHHLLVGDAQSRGGVEIAHLNEWGGKNIDGTYGFDTNRPGWGKPVHQVLADNKVSYVFKGHDHLYVKQELDGIIYQTIAQPSHPGNKVNPGQYGYNSGKAVGGSGFLKVATKGRESKVEFILFDGTLGDSYVKQV